MMNYFILTVLSSFSILVPACTGLYRFRMINKIFYPFLFLIWLGVLNETISLVLVYTSKTNLANSNIYTLIEYGLILYLFYKWRDGDLKFIISLIITGLVLWVTDNLILHRVTDNNSIFRIFYSFVIVFFSIDQINRLIVFEQRSLLKNPVFLICFAFLMSYSYAAFTEVFIAFDLNLGNHFSEDIFMVITIANCFFNFLYTVAILCILPEEEFLMPY